MSAVTPQSQLLTLYINENGEKYDIDDQCMKAVVESFHIVKAQKGFRDFQRHAQVVFPLHNLNAIPVQWAKKTSAETKEFQIFNPLSSRFFRNLSINVSSLSILSTAENSSQTDSELREEISNRNPLNSPHDKNISLITLAAQSLLKLLYKEEASIPHSIPFLASRDFFPAELSSLTVDKNASSDCKESLVSHVHADLKRNELHICLAEEKLDTVKKIRRVLRLFFPRTQSVLIQKGKDLYAALSEELALSPASSLISIDCLNNIPTNPNILYVAKTLFKSNGYACDEKQIWSPEERLVEHQLIMSSRPTNPVQKTLEVAAFDWVDLNSKETAEALYRYLLEKMGSSQERFESEDLKRFPRPIRQEVKKAFEIINHWPVTEFVWEGENGFPTKTIFVIDPISHSSTGSTGTSAASSSASASHSMPGKSKIL